MYAETIRPLFLLICELRVAFPLGRYSHVFSLSVDYRLIDLTVTQLPITSVIRHQKNSIVFIVEGLLYSGGLAV